MPDYGMGYEASVDDSPLPHADPFVETADWSRPLTPSPDGGGEVCFVDGVRRVDLRLLADSEGRRVPGLFGSHAVGAVRCDGRAAFDRHRLSRSVVLGGGMRTDRVEVPCGKAVLSFEPCSDPRVDSNAPLEKLQDLMRDAEQNLAAEVVQAGAPLVLVDGPLRWKEVSEPGAPVVGLVKRFVRRYLDPDQEALLARLDRGDRTPVFALSDERGTVRGYSWYARLAEFRPPWHDLAGIMRCEVRAGVGLAGAVALAERVTGLLPSFAGRAVDPRTPQNLAPVAGLEQWLRHRMGDRTMVRRVLLGWLARTKERVYG
jgi:hypothetical protein